MQAAVPCCRQQFLPHTQFASESHVDPIILEKPDSLVMTHSSATDPTNLRQEPAPQTQDFGARVYSRGFLISTESAKTIEQNVRNAPYAANLRSWQKTYFGPLTLWMDPALNYACERTNTHGVGVLGLCINPFDGLDNNQDISRALFEALQVSRQMFLEYVDQLSGSFIIIYRINNLAFLLQDAAATKPVYYHSPGEGKVTVSNCITLLQHLHGLDPDRRAREVFANSTYRSDPSRYLPGMITAVKEVAPLTANHEFDFSRVRSNRFFPREPLGKRKFESSLVEQIAGLMVQQANIIGRMGRPLVLAATGGRDSRVSAVSFSGQPGLSYFSFHAPTSNHLTEDVETAKELARIEDVPLAVYELENYRDAAFRAAFQAHSPLGIWPAAAECYIREFPDTAIHIRSTVSEIGRIFYSRRNEESVTPECLARTYTRTDFNLDPMVLETFFSFIEATDFRNERFFDFSLYDMFYWEHRNAKWQNVLCAEAEMATDVFIPFNNRDLLKLFMSIPFENRMRADLHLGVCKLLKPEFNEVPIV